MIRAYPNVNNGIRLYCNIECCRFQQTRLLFDKEIGIWMEFTPQFFMYIRNTHTNTQVILSRTFNTTTQHSHGLACSSHSKWAALFQRASLASHSQTSTTNISFVMSYQWIFHSVHQNYYMRFFFFLFTFLSFLLSFVCSFFLSFSLYLFTLCASFSPPFCCCCRFFCVHSVCHLKSLVGIGAGALGFGYAISDRVHLTIAGN